MTGNEPRVTLRIERDGRELWRSAAAGIRPLVEAVTTLGEELRGTMAYDKVVGLASARLLVYAGVADVEADVASVLAVRFAREADMMLRAVVVTPRILNRERTGPCPMETLALTVDSPAAFFEAALHELGLDGRGENAPEET